MSLRTNQIGYPQWDFSINLEQLIFLQHKKITTYLVLHFLYFCGVMGATIVGLSLRHIIRYGFFI